MFLGISRFRVPQLCNPAIELRSWSLNSLEKVSERLQHLAVPYANLAVPSATQAKGALDSREMSLPTPRGSVVDVIQRLHSMMKTWPRWRISAGTALRSVRPSHEITHDLVEAWSLSPHDVEG